MRLQNKRILVVICTIAGSGQDVRPQIETFLNKHFVAYTIRRAKIPPDAKRIIESQGKKYDLIAIYGGDGSVNAGIKAAATVGVKLLIIPGGTGNVIAKHLKLPMHSTGLFRLYAKGLYGVVDYPIARAEDELLALDMYIGWWAKATAETPRSLKKRFGQIAYGLSALKSFSPAMRQKYVFDFGDRRVRISGYTAIVANRDAQVFMGLPLFTGRHRADTIKVAVLKSVSPFRFIVWSLGRVFSKHNLGGLIKTFQTKELTIISAPKELLFDDYETVLKTPVKIVAAQQNAQVIVPLQPQTGLGRLQAEVRLIWFRLAERIRNRVTGKPSSQFSQVAPGIYLGGSYRRPAYLRFKEWNITGTINMRSTTQFKIPDGVELLQLKTRDHQAPSITDLDQGVAFAKEKLGSGGSIYIHCRQGEGRGPTMAAACLVADGYSVPAALDHIARCRPMAHPNRKQVRALVSWSKHYNKKNELTAQSGR